MQDIFNNIFGGLFGAIGGDSTDFTGTKAPDPAIFNVIQSGPDQGREWLMRDYPYQEAHPTDDWVQESFQNMANEAWEAKWAKQRAAAAKAARDPDVDPNWKPVDPNAVVTLDDSFLYPQEVPQDSTLYGEDVKPAPSKVPLPTPPMRLGANPAQEAAKSIQAAAPPVSIGTIPERPRSMTEAVKKAYSPGLNLRGTWTARDPRWAALSPVQKAAAMSLMEADKMDITSARNAAAAMVNRATKNKQDLGMHVSARIYQPTFEPAQQKRLDRILKSTQYQQMVQWIERYQAGLENDPTNGATHFLAHPRVMLALEAREPRKYRSWRSWTGFNQATGTYRNQTMTDTSHAFLAPEGRFSYAEYIRAQKSIAGAKK